MKNKNQYIELMQINNHILVHPFKIGPQPSTDPSTDLTENIRISLFREVLRNQESYETSLAKQVVASLEDVSLSKIILSGNEEQYLKISV